MAIATFYWDFFNPDNSLEIIHSIYVEQNRTLYYFYMLLHGIMAYVT